MITLANIRRSVYNLFKRVEGIEEFLIQFVTDWTDFKEEGIIANQAFPETWHKTGVLNNLIQDINADDTATTGKVYTATVSFNDLPSNMLQAELKVEIKEDSGKVILFTLISNETAPYYWLGISSYSGEVVWKSFLTEHQDISGKANIEDLSTVATTGNYEDLSNTPTIPDAQIQSDWNQTDTEAKDYIKNKPHALDGKSAYELAVDNGFEGTEQEWLASLKGEQGIQGIQGIQGPAGQNGSDGANGQDGAPGQDGVTPHIDSTTKHWMIGTTDTGVVAEGLDGSDTTINTNDLLHTPTNMRNYENNREYVEIGGIKWATMNVGATSILDVGLYFQQGDTQGYTADLIEDGQKSFSPSTHKYWLLASGGLGGNYTKYTPSDMKTVLDDEDDAAVANWGGDWRMPTKDEVELLIANTRYQYVTNYENSGVTVVIFTDKNDQSKKLIFPVGGCYSGTRLFDVTDTEYPRAYTWTSTIEYNQVPDGPNATLGSYEDFPINLCAMCYLNTSSFVFVGCGNLLDRSNGCPVRAVLDGYSNTASKVAITGSYNDLTDKPTIPDAQIQSDWNQTTTTAKDFIKNKPNLLQFSNITRTNDPNDYGFVDLDLPSGTLWLKGGIDTVALSYIYAPTNTASTDYYAKDRYDPCNYTLGGNWHTPTKHLFEELLIWKTQASVKKYDINSPTYAITLSRGTKYINFNFSVNNEIQNGDSAIYFLSSTKSDNGYYALKFLISRSGDTLSVSDVSIVEKESTAGSGQRVFVKAVLDHNTNKKTSTIIDNSGHNYVDLGLPSGTLWADKNIGASSLTDVGTVYTSGSRLDKKPEELWGGSWHAPTVAQIEELFENTTVEFISGDCCKFTGPNGNYIILPKTDVYSAGGYYGHYISRDFDHYDFNNGNSLYSSHDEKSSVYYNCLTIFSRNEQQYVRISYINPINDISIRPVLDGAPTNHAKIWRGTQAQYDAITAPDPNTIYIITSAS